MRRREGYHDYVNLMIEMNNLEKATLKHLTTTWIL